MKNLFTLYLLIFTLASFGETYTSYATGNGWIGASTTWTRQSDGLVVPVDKNTFQNQSNTFIINHSINLNDWLNADNTPDIIIDGNADVKTERHIKNANVEVRFGSSLDVVGSIYEQNSAVHSLTNLGTVTLTQVLSVANITNSGTLSTNSIGEVLNNLLTVNNSGTMSVASAQWYDSQFREINNTGTLNYLSTVSLNNNNNKIYNSNGGSINIGGTFSFGAGVFTNGKDKLGNISTGTINIDGISAQSNSSNLYNNGIYIADALDMAGGTTVTNDCSGNMTINGTGSVFNSNTHLYNGGIITFMDNTHIQDASIANGSTGSGLGCDGTFNFHGNLKLTNASACIVGGNVNFVGGGSLDPTSTGCNLSANTTLPIELITFSGQEKENTIRLNWTTASEINNAFFTIEKSIDGYTFSSIGEVKGTGNSSATLKYDFVDQSPNEGLNYYRLKQTDFDGTSRYFTPIAISFQNIYAFVYPTVITKSSNVTVQLSNENPVKYRIIGQEGKLICQGSISGVKDIPGNLFQYGVNQIIIGEDDSQLSATIVKQ